jgi:hypothetical protein
MYIEIPYSHFLSDIHVSAVFPCAVVPHTEFTLTSYELKPHGAESSFRRQ